MSWKPYRGGRILLDKAVKDAHECYFKFYETHDFVDKCKVAFKWMKAELYLHRRNPFPILGQEFITEVLNNPKAYKPLVRLLNEKYIT